MFRLPTVFGLRLFAVLAFVFIYAPIAVMVVFSFNTSAISVWPLEGFTFDWYVRMAQASDIRAAFVNSMVVAGTSTAVAGVLGTLGAYTAHRFRFVGKHALQRVVLMPLVVPGVVTGIALLTMFDRVKLQLSLRTIILGHVTFLIAVFFTMVFARLQSLGVAIDRAAMDLGASRLRAFVFAILPNLKLTLVGAAVIAFTLSFDEIAVTYFLTGTQNTVPMLIYSMLRTGLTPTVNALATFALLFSLLPIVVASVITARLGRDSEVEPWTV